jgi:hypothetical protein
MTKAQELGINQFLYEEFDERGNRVYLEYSSGFWEKREYDEHGNNIYWESSGGFWGKYEYDDYGKCVYLENFLGEIWRKEQ